MRFRPLAAKLTLAIAVVGIASILLVTVVVGWQMRREFDRFVVNRFGADLANRLGAYYGQTGSWQGVDALLRSEIGGGQGVVPLVIVDANGNILFGRQRAGSAPDPAKATYSIPIYPGNEDDAPKAGYIVFDPPTFGSLPAGSPERRFRDRVVSAATWGAAAAVGLALGLGFLLARSLTRPLRELTEASRALAQGELGKQVLVKTDDEVGELVRAFNQMSGDLERAMHTRRQMTADIAHDLRTPLSVILGYAEALDEGKFAPTPEVFTILHEEALHLNHLIDDLRLLSVADAGELVLRRSRVNPSDLIMRAASAHRLVAETKGISLGVEGDGALPEVEVDSERMAQVLDNLIGNAIRHTPPGGAITLRARNGEGRVELDVQDTGEGIAPEEIESIFDRFYRGDKARRQTGESGLGLAIARSLVEAHSGALTVQSQLGRGATFTIALPVA